MYANSYQKGPLTVFYSGGSCPLSKWDQQVKNGHIRRLMDEDNNSLVLEIAGTNVATTFISCPSSSNTSLGIKLPFLVMVLKNLKRYFSFEVQILDDKNMQRRFRVSNFQTATKVRPFCTQMPMGLNQGWNQININLADFTRRLYGTGYLETVRMQIHANVRLRRIYFADNLYEIPKELKHITNQQNKKRPSRGDAAKEAAATRQEAPEVPPPPSPVEQEAQSEEQHPEDTLKTVPEEEFDEKDLELALVHDLLEEMVDSACSSPVIADQ